MSDSIKHECGIALIRLLKPIDYYKKKYGTKLFALNKMFLMMQKQVNRGQDGAGWVSLKLDVDPGKKYINRIRSVQKNSIENIFQTVEQTYFDLKKKNPKNLYFVIGSDILINFHKWKSWKKIAKLVKLIVFSRKGYDKKGKDSTVVKFIKKKNIIFI